MEKDTTDWCWNKFNFEKMRISLLICCIILVIISAGAQDCNWDEPFEKYNVTLILEVAVRKLHCKC